MKTFIVILLNSKWYSFNVENDDEFFQGIPSIKENTLVSFQTSDLIRTIKSRKFFHTVTLIDLECLDRQMSQVGKDLRPELRWKLRSALEYHNIITEDELKKRVTAKTMCLWIKSLYRHLTINFPEELERFKTVELKVNNIIYQRQAEGVSLNSELVIELCKRSELEMYAIKNKLQLEFGLFSPELQEEQLHYLKSKGINLIRSIEFTVKAWRNVDEGCWLLYSLIRTRQDFENLLMMQTNWGGLQKCYPSYFGFGSITSRITVREPALQNIRKAVRSVIIPKAEYKLLYIDFSQFEAGIIASLSSDQSLIDLYAEDIYTDIAQEILSDKTKRSEAKILFYRFIYGDDSLSKQTKEYFLNFNQLTLFKKSIENKAKTSNVVGTELGNFRKLTGLQLHRVLSHKIQATASLIYKNALIRTFDQIPEAKFVLPMHDATLYEIPISSYDVICEQIKVVYIEEFMKSCPNISPIVTTKSTFE